MISNYLKLTLRKFKREKLYSAINLAGLSIAIACCLILALYLRIELTYDQHNLNHDRIYRIASEFTANGKAERFALSPRVLAPMLAEEYDEVEEYVTFNGESPLYRRGEDLFELEVRATDTRVFDVFTLDIIYGDANTAIQEGGTIAISESVAKRIFGDTNPIGEILTNEDNNPLAVTLVFADLPENSHLFFDALNFSRRPALEIPEGITERREQLTGVNSYSYLLMREDFDISNFEQMMSDFRDRHMAEQLARYNVSARFWLEPLADIHHQSNVGYDEPQGNAAYLYALMAVAIFILLIACINYINLSTARTTGQAKSVGMQKILGANTNSLRLQFIVEAILFTLAASLIGLILVELVLSFTPISTLLGKTLELSLIEEPQILLWLILFILITGLCTGVYPAIYLSSWAPLSALMNKPGGSSNITLRKALVLAQFTVSVAVVAGTLLMANQMRYLSEKSLGFDKENRIFVEMIGAEVLRKFPVMKNEFLQHPGILGVSANDVIFGQNTPINGFEIEQNSGATETHTISHFGVEEDFVGVMGMNLIEGRDFTQKLLTDSNAGLIANEALVRQMGWENPIGKRIVPPGPDGENAAMNIIGVVEDFHFQSLHSTITPFAIRVFEGAWEDTGRDRPRGGVFMARNMIVNIDSDHIRETLDYLEERFQEFDPKHPFKFTFLDEELNRLYDSDQRLMRLIAIFSGICIFISCLGLFGLASSATEQRNKEIGVRKVLGANASQIIFLLSKNILLLVLIGACIGSLIAYFSFSFWLSGFAYRSGITLIPYLIAALAALAVAYVTVALQSYKTAQADPIDALRYE